MKTIQIFSFEELSPEAQEVALEQFKNDVSNGAIPEIYDHDPLIEGMKEELAEIGIESVDVNYSGFWSQGDGLCFTGEVKNVKLFSESLGLLNLKDWDIVKFRKTSTRYNHENTIETDLRIDWHVEESFKKVWNDLFEKIEDWRKSKCREFYNRLEKHYDYCSSDEVVKEELIEREYHFTEKGKKVNL
jgi:hypothetical protein